MKKYFGNLFTVISKIKHESPAAIVDMHEIPKNWKIQKSYYDNLMLNIQKDNEIVDKYVIQKRDHKLDTLFTNMVSLMNDIKPMVLICGEEHVHNCDTSLKTYSKVTSKNCGELLKYIFIVLLKSLLNIDVVMFNSLKNVKINTSTFEDDDIDLPGVLDKSKKARKGSKSSKSNVDVDIEEDADLLGSSVIEDISLDLSVERTHSQKLTCNLVYDLLVILQNNQDFYDKHTTKYMNEVIEKKMDSEKEENLKFIEELDKESRQSLKSMITIGFDSWKNLSKKEDKNLYFGENLQENVIAEDNSFDINYNEEELDTINRERALQALGENYTEEQYTEFLERSDEDRREEMQVQNDMDVMYDDDGDGEFGAEDEHEF